MSTTELLQAAQPYVFTALAAAAVRQWLLRRDLPGRELALTFSVLSGMLLVSEALPYAGDGLLAELLVRVVLLALALFPYLLLRFAAAFEALPGWVTRTGGVLVGAVLAATLGLPPLPDSGSAPAWLSLYLVALLVEWTFLSFAVSWRLWVAGAGLPRVARRRMRTLAAGAAVLVIGLIAAIAPGSDSAWIDLSSAVLALASGALFLVGFAPPAWLVRTWRGDTEAVQRLLVGLVGETDGAEVVHGLLPRMLDLVGARGAALVDGAGKVVASVGAVHADREGEGRPLADGVRQIDAGHVRVDLDDGALHVWTGPYAPYFGRAELGLLTSFGALLQLSLQRTASTSREREAAAALEEAQGIAGIGSWRWSAGGGEPQWSREMYRLYGLPVGSSLAGGAFSGVAHPDDRARVDAEIARATREGHDVVLDYRICPAPGVLRWVQSRVHVDIDDAGRLAAVFGTCQDVTERRTLERDLQHQALHDPLTGLPNRRLLVDLLGQGVRGGGTAVLFLDVDRFKIVNDSLGHDVGDQVLLAVAERLTGAVREGDVVGRFGGDEFVVLAAVADEADALAMAERLRTATADPVVAGMTELVVTLSTGIALCLDGRTPAVSMVRDADAAMYAAKRAGGDRAVLFAEAMRAAVVDRLAVEVDLRRALVEDQLRVHYQPVVDVRSGELVGAEALVRWQHPTRGLLGPAEFVGVAEETGQIVELGAEVLRQACRQLRQWQDAHPHLGRMWMSVNLSALQVFSSGLIEQVVAAVHDAGIAPECLTLEITESVLMTDVEEALEVLAALRVLGVRLSVDDFGTGYSSLAYLTRLPVSSLKVDRSFLARIDDDPHALAVVQAVVALANALDLAIVAEGVETERQLATVRRLGCGLAQGFLLGRPVPAEKWAAWLRAGRSVPAPRAGESAALLTGNA